MLGFSIYSLVYDHYHTDRILSNPTAALANQREGLSKQVVVVGLYSKRVALVPNAQDHLVHRHGEHSRSHGRMNTPRHDDVLRDSFVFVLVSVYDLGLSVGLICALVLLV